MRAQASLSRRAALLGGVCACCMPSLLRAAALHQRDLRTVEIAPGIHIRRGAHEIATPHNDDAIANTGFIVGTDCVAVMDPGGSLDDGNALRRRIREITALPIRYVLMSHVHPDHIFGAGAFLQDDAEFVGHRELPNAMAQRGEYYRARLDEILGPGAAGPVVAPTRLVDERTRIDLGGREIELSAHGVAHTNNDLSALDLSTGTLFPSDLLFVTRVPSLDGSLKGWLRELQALQAIQSKRAVPGHGPASVDFNDAAAKLSAYLEILLRETRQAIAEGVEIDAAPGSVGHSEREKWLLFDDYHGHNVTQAFKELEWE